jgi:hypothetical protein
MDDLDLPRLPTLGIEVRIGTSRQMSRDVDHIPFGH